MFKVNNKDTRATGVFIFSVEHILHLVLVFLLLTMSKYMPTGLTSENANFYKKNLGYISKSLGLLAFIFEKVILLL